MFPNPIPLNNGTTTVNFDFRGASENASVYKAPALEELSLVPTFKIGHQTSNPNSIRERRNSRYGLIYPVKDSQGNLDNISVDVVVRVPVRIADSATTTEVLTQVKNFLSTAGYIAKIVAAEV